ncbi:hypothetical protein FAUST_11649 [Fusarium austroamericanum]|uniref:Uncharacterized protein n=1 Tax=Fusarium austroamericanum TaxID=282268 RepID=A0AAN5YZY2_FUSAU|nr:hypothetical protein FAUST_11649 [Fusarium austroamericanum]
MSSSNQTGSMAQDSPYQYTQPILSHKGGKIPFVQARVLGEGGDGHFIDHFEATSSNCMDDIQRVYRRQPAFHQPRIDWTHWDPNQPILIDIADDSLTLQRKLEAIQHPYYDRPDSSLSFTFHAADCRDLMRDLVGDVMVEGHPILALARMASYGLENVISVARYQIQIKSKIPKPNRDFQPTQPALLPTHYKMDCYVDCGFQSVEELRTHMYGKRFFIGIIHHAGYVHWTSFIWDRVRGDLYHFDTYEPDQVERTRHVAYMWRELLASCGLPYSFNIFQGPLTPQPDTISCGPLSIFMIFRFLRGLVGCTGDEMVKMHGYCTLKLADQPSTGASKAPALLFSDWVVGLGQDRPSTMNAKSAIALSFIKGFFFHLCLDDIGIQNGKTTRTKVKKDGTTETTQLAPLNKNLIRWTIMSTTSGFPTEDLYTDFRGLMPVAPSFGVQKGWSHHRLMSFPQGAAGPSSIHAFMIMPPFQPTFQAMPPHLAQAFYDRGVQFDGTLPMRANVNVSSTPVELSSDSESAESAESAESEDKAVQTIQTPSKPPQTPPPVLSSPKPSDQMHPSVLSTPKASDQQVSQHQPHNSVTPINKPRPKSKTPAVASPSTPVPTKQSPLGALSTLGHKLLLPKHLQEARTAAGKEKGHIDNDDYQPSSKSASEVSSSELSDYGGSDISNLLDLTDRMSIDGSHQSASAMDLSYGSRAPSRAPSSTSSEAVRPAPRRTAVEDNPPALVGAQHIDLDDLPADAGLAERMAQAPAGAMVMSVNFGERFRHHVGGGDRSTWRLPRGNYITFVPTGLAEPDHWDSVIFPDLSLYFIAASSPAPDQLTRAQRLEARNRRNNRSD